MENVFEFDSFKKRIEKMWKGKIGCKKKRKGCEENF